MTLTTGSADAASRGTICSVVRVEVAVNNDTSGLPTTTDTFLLVAMQYSSLVTSAGSFKGDGRVSPPTYLSMATLEVMPPRRV